MSKHGVIFLTLIVMLLTYSLGIAQVKPGNPERGKAIYLKHCVRCHGEKGDGQGPDADSLIVRPTNFQDPVSRAKTNKELLSVVVWGGVYSPMHEWWSQLSKEEMLDVISYIRKLAPYTLYSPFPEFEDGGSE